MTVDSKYAMTFRSNGLTRRKYGEIYSLARHLLDVRNRVSLVTNGNLLKYLNASRFDFRDEMKELFRDEVPGPFVDALYTDVYTAYQNKFDAIQKKISFNRITSLGFETYSRNVGNHRKGDLKRILTERKSTPLAKALTYLARYGNENILDYVKSQIGNCEEKKVGLYENILRCCDKFGFERLYGLALSRRIRTVFRYSRHPITFRSLTFRGVSRKKRILEYNKRFGSAINAFITLSGFSTKSFCIPVKFSKDHHGKMGEYAKTDSKYSYVLKFRERLHEVDVILVKDGKREYPEPGENAVGIDVNSKTNLFTVSDGTTYDYDREIVNDFVKISQETDELKSRNPDYVVGKRRQRKLDALRMKMRRSEERIIASMCREFRKKGVTHVAMEDLDNSFGKTRSRDRDFGDVNYNRKLKFLGIGSLKNEFSHIARKYGIAVSTVHACFTSQMCPVCGCIDEGNRDRQSFRCVRCGHEANADLNASVNIRNRVLSTVLRDRLLEKNKDTGAFEPRRIKVCNVKKTLVSCWEGLAKNQSVNDWEDHFLDFSTCSTSISHNKNKDEVHLQV